MNRRDEPRQSLGYTLGALHQALRQAMDEALRPHGLTLLQVGVLATLKRSPGVSSAELARARFVTPQTMNEVIAGLEEAELIERRPHPEGGRVLQTYLSPAGAERLSACRAAVSGIEGQMLKGLAKTDQRKLRVLLLACLTNLIAPQAAEVRPN